MLFYCHLSPFEDNKPVSYTHLDVYKRQIMYNTGFSENVHSYVNNINTIEGGTHLAGFRRALTRTLKKYAEDSKIDVYKRQRSFLFLLSMNALRAR